jgi:2'-5' RNA ligase
MATLTPTMEKALTQFREIGTFDGFRASTVAGLERRGRIRQSESGYTLSETNGDIQPLKQLRTTWFDPIFDPNIMVDWGTIDYNWWDRARNGQVKGLEKAGLLLQPLASKTAAWSLGLQPKIRCKRAKTQDLLTKWFARVHSDVLRAFEDAVALADCFLIVNPPDKNGHMPLTVVPASSVRPIVHEEDFSKIVGWQISERHPHPTRVGEYMVIVDEYYADKRIRRISKNGGAEKRQEYKNLLGRIPVIKLSFARRASEKFGRPIGAALLYLLLAYEQVLNDAIVGNRKQGRPTPVIEKMGSVQQITAFWQQFGRKEKYKASDGTEKERFVLDLSSDDVLTLGGDAQFRYAQPGSFTADTLNILQLLFYLLIEHSEFPEFIMGNAIASSKASAETQLPPFVKFIQKIQGQCEYWLFELLIIAMAYLSLWETGVAVEEDVSVKWPKLTTDDGRLTLEAATLALENNLLTDEEVLALLPLDVDDPQASVAKARAEAEKRRQEEERLDRQNETPLPGLKDDTEQQASEMVSEAARNSAIVAFMLDEAAAEMLYDAAADADLEDITPVDEMHLTLAFLGNTADMDVDEEQVAEALKDFALGEFGIVGQISGIGRFKAVEGNTDALYASFDAPDLPDFRQALVAALEQAGVSVSKDHGFTPHVTLAYLGSEDPTPEIDIPAIKLIFETVTLAWGKNKTTFALKSARVAAAA